MQPGYDTSSSICGLGRFYRSEDHDGGAHFEFKYVYRHYGKLLGVEGFDWVLYRLVVVHGTVYRSILRFFPRELVHEPDVQVLNICVQW